ncbi:MAG: glycosyltransferase family 4 protein [Syntrophobacterales bacterium]|nr:glycosyltransferase family 4 protein [Syntrophobacterales bacterium]
MERIKVIHVVTRFDKGGSAENTFLTVMGLDKQKYDVLLVKGMSVESAMGEEERKAVGHSLSRAERAGVRISTVPDLVRDVRPVKDWRAFWALLNIFRRERPHIVHTHTSKAGFLGRWAARLSKVPLIVHTPHGHVFWGYFNRPTSLFYALLERWTARITDRIVVLTEQEKKDHLSFCIAPEDKFEVVHSGVGLDNFRRVRRDPAQAKEDLGIPSRAAVIGTVGRLTPIKGHRFLIEAARGVLAEHPDTVFILVGDGESAEALRSLATRLGVSGNIRFLGWRPDVAEIISAVDIFVFPSLNEGMGRAVVEAMALGKPVVASRVGGIVDIVRDGENGLLVPPADSDELAAAIKSLLSDPAERERLGQEGKRQALLYDAERMVRRIEVLYSIGRRR